MPIEIKYIDSGPGVLFLGKGKITGEDIICSNRQNFSSEEIMLNNKYGLTDYSDVTEFVVSNSEIETIDEVAGLLWAIMMFRDRKDT